MKRFRVLSYNIHKGFSARNRAFVLREIREAIRSVAPDFLFLQEVLGEHRGHERRVRGWPWVAQFEFLAEALWPHFAYGRNAVYDEGHHGNAILSKHPILSYENEDVSTTKLERRGILHAVVRPFESRPELHLMCAHFGLLERDRQYQARRLCDRVRRTVELGQGLVVAGDFNDWTLRLSRLFKHQVGLDEAYQTRHHRHARTFPARMPVLRLDRIYFHGLEPRLAKCLHRGPWAALSDHAALLADFEWR
ncbi:MAG: endonuclease/exonuclease/phosphatase family protein [Deltaproteobacteria bacterium]|nr:endonuclease/exonuclease/phosphatase family protein [Deltaproteobacteria bacterium]